MFGSSYSTGPNWFLILLYLIFGVYFINYPFSFIPIPTVISNFDKWIILVGGILIIFGAVNYFRASRSSY